MRIPAWESWCHSARILSSPRVVCARTQVVDEFDDIYFFTFLPEKNLANFRRMYHNNNTHQDWSKWNNSGRFWEFGRGNFEKRLEGVSRHPFSMNIKKQGGGGGGKSSECSTRQWISCFKETLVIEWKEWVIHSRWHFVCGSLIVWVNLLTSLTLTPNCVGGSMVSINKINNGNKAPTIQPLSSNLWCQMFIRVDILGGYKRLWRLSIYPIIVCINSIRISIFIVG